MLFVVKGFEVGLDGCLRARGEVGHGRWLLAATAFRVLLFLLLEQGWSKDSGERVLLTPPINAQRAMSPEPVEWHEGLFCSRFYRCCAKVSVLRTL